MQQCTFTPSISVSSSAAAGQGARVNTAGHEPHEGGEGSFYVKAMQRYLRVTKEKKKEKKAVPIPKSSSCGKGMGIMRHFEGQ